MRELSASRLPRKVALASVGLVGAVLTIGTVWAFQRGGHDFDVFYHAWGLVLSGRGREIYTNSPDRFLYAPGFAWLLSPLGLLPRWLALAAWCLSKTVIVGWLLLAVGSRLPGRAGEKNIALIARTGMAALGLLLVARPFLIDFGYGQVNIFILAAALWALFEHTAPAGREGMAPFVSWACLACAAVAKIFPLPLLLIPFVDFSKIPGKRLKRERAGILAGALVLLLLPVLSEGPAGLAELFTGWKGALLAKGLPLESHNQSFVAFLNHYFTGNPTRVIAEGYPPLLFGVQAFDSSTLTLLSLGWTLSCAGFLLAWLLAGPRRDSLRWISIAVATLILPSHLVWKTYFVTGFPLAAWLLSRGGGLVFPALVFLLVNLTGFDFLGHGLAARLEAGSVLLFVQLAMIGAGVMARP
jgi:hypothetical protein